MTANPSGTSLTATLLAFPPLPRAIWGMITRVGIGAILSLLDIVTDIYSMYNFVRTGDVGFAYATGAMIGLSMVFQGIIVFLQNKRMPLVVLVREFLFVLLCVKPVSIKATPPSLFEMSTF